MVKIAKKIMPFLEVGNASWSSQKDLRVVCKKLNGEMGIDKTGTVERTL